MDIVTLLMTSIVFSLLSTRDFIDIAVFSLLPNNEISDLLVILHDPKITVHISFLGNLKNAVLFPNDLYFPKVSSFR